uniref:Transposase, MuDR, MULE transposase domain protein n=1 Tax=Tanacetum cinerariifolium TaxID=118510 RepID=A0A6L2JUQ0_TANCI|nr:transposase, MuDR, MULE transposase domain protein [Tanacetum cinerariifolium]
MLDQCVMKFWNCLLSVLCKVAACHCNIFIIQLFHIKKHCACESLNILTKDCRKCAFESRHCSTSLGDGFLDSKGGAKNLESNKDKQPTLSDVLDEVRALRKKVALVKFDDARITKLERILNDKFMFRNDSPNDGKNDSPNGNQNGVRKGLSCSANDLIVHGEVAGALIGIHNADGKNDSPKVNHNVVNKRLYCSANDPMYGIHKVDRQNDIPNANHNAVNQEICGSANDPMVLGCSIQVAYNGMGIDKADGNNDYTYSQREPSTLDILVQGFDSQKNHPGIDVLQHDTHVDCSVAKLNDHPITDIGVKPVHVDEFADDFMDVLNDEEIIPNYSLDDMKLQDKEEKLISTLAPINDQQVDELIDVHEDKTTMLQENVKDQSNKSQYVNVVTDDYKPYLGMILDNVKTKRSKCGIERNYALRFVKERKKRLAMALDSLFGQQATTTPSSPKTISMSVNEDFIAPPEFLEDVSGELKMRSINELMTLEVFVEPLSRPHYFIRDKVTMSDGFSNFIKMQDPLEYQFPWDYRDIIVDREFWSLTTYRPGNFHRTYLGTNLVVVGMDGNNQIIPIATGVSQGETGESWTWFLRKLKECIERKQSFEETIRTSEQTYKPTSAEEKLDRRNEMKARGTLLIALPNKDQLKFHSYQDAKLLMEAIEKSTSRTNEAYTTASGVSTAHTQGTNVNSTSVDILSDAVICAFLTSQPNSPQLAKEDLEKIDLDDLEEMDLD